VDPARTRLGADHDATTGRTSFLVWAPAATVVELVLGGDADAPGVPMERLRGGYHGLLREDAPPGTRYRYRLHRDGHDPVVRADPASRWQPDGLHGPSAVDDPAFAWTDDAWHAPPLHRQVLYEMHVGTFTAEGTFDAVVDHLGDLAELGVTTLEIMPVAQVAGGRNWGYDGVLLYAVQEAYGGPAGLRRLVDAAHAHGLAVVLDVVYNHLGPEGDHHGDFGPYFTDRVATPWGRAVNLDGPASDEVRRHVVENAVRWVTDFHLDGLRLDAVHALHDDSAVHVLEELAGAVHDAADSRGRRAVLIAESDLQDPRVVRPTAVGGLGLDAQWLDDVHHAVHVAVTGEREGYYEDYDGLADLARALRDRYAIAGRYSSFRQRTVGRPARDVPHHRFVVCIQNHDQVGNRMLGERLAEVAGVDAATAAAGALLLSPFTPMLWMGEEYADPAPFQFFASHTDPELIEMVREGRASEFEYFAEWQDAETPDPQSEETFRRSTLDRSLRTQGRHAQVEACYAALLRARREVPAVAHPESGEPLPRLHGPALAWSRTGPDGGRALVIVNPAPEPVTVALDGEHAGDWSVALDTADEAYGGPGATAPPTGRDLEVGPRRTLLLVEERDDAPQEGT
jgi:maltooligosyltrehalose trehalohydrolase